jgi:hypothetical protein
MTRIAAIEEQTFIVPASAEESYAFFSDWNKMREALVGVQVCELLPQGQVHWVLEEIAELGIRFQGDYIVSYQGNGTDYVCCRSVSGNMGNEWDVWLRRVKEGTEIRFRESVEPDLPINAILAFLIKPLVKRKLRENMNSFIEQVRKRLAP